MRLLHCSIILLCIATGPRALAAAPDEALAALLREGGLTVYFRHAKTDQAQVDRRGVAPEDCANQRNLSEEGRAQARAIGAAMRAMALAIEEEVPASPYCRTMETARLITGRATPTRAVLGKRTPEGKVDYAELSALFTNPPPRGRIRVVVSHGNQLHEMMAAAVPGELPEAEAAIFAGDGVSYRLLRTVAADEWPRLAAPR